MVPRMFETDSDLMVSADFESDYEHPEEVFFNDFQLALAQWFDTEDGAHVWNYKEGNFDLIDLDPQEDLTSESFLSIFNSYGIYDVIIDEIDLSDVAA